MVTTAKVRAKLIHIKYGELSDAHFNHIQLENEQTTIHLFPYILLILSIIVSITGKETIKWKTSHKIIITLIILAVTFLVFTSMFLGCSKTDSRVIQGVQGRYFMPIIPLVFLLFGKKFIDTPQWAKRISMLVVIMQIYVVTTLFIHHI